MKRIFIIMFLIFTSSVASGGDMEDHHLLGKWMLNIDSILVSFKANPSRLILVPYDVRMDNLLPGGYSEGQLPSAGTSSEDLEFRDIVRQGAVIEVTGFGLRKNPTLGDMKIIYAKCEGKLKTYESVDLYLFHRYSDIERELRKEWIKRPN